MPELQNPPWAKILATIFWGAVALVVVIVALRQIQDPDIWWHMKTGERILQEFRLPTEDSFAYTSSFFQDRSEEFILQQYWLTDVSYALAFKALGFTGISLLSGLLFAAIIASMAWRMQKGNAATGLTWLVVAMTMLAMTRLCSFERPQIVSFLLASILMGWCEAIRRGHRPHWLIVPLMILWGNCHGGVVVGDVLLAIFAVAAAYQYRTEPKTRNRIWFWTAAGLVGSFVNPSNLDLIAITSGAVEQDAVIKEFKTLLWWYANQDRFAGGYLLLIICGALAVFLRRKRDLFSCLATITLAAMAVYYVRIVPFYLVAVLPTAVQNWSKSPATWSWKQASPAVLAIALVFGGVYQERALRGINVPARVYENNALFPVAVADFLQKEVALPGNMFNDYRAGGYLIWRLYPQYRVFIDTRTFAPELFAEYRKVADLGQGSRVAYREIFSKYGVDFVVRRHQTESGRLDQVLKNLLRDSEWVQIYLDDYWYVAVRRSERNQAIIDRYGAATGDYQQALFVRFSDKLARGEELVKNHLTRADLALYLGNLPAAEVDIGAALALAPGQKTATTMLNELSAYKHLR